LLFIMSSIVTGNLLKNIPITQLILVTIGITAISFLFSKQYLHALISVLAIIVVQQLFSIEEGFTTDSTKEFLDLQSTINPLKNFDMDAIGRQATQEEMDYYLKNKMWPWSEELKEVYTSAIISNPYVRLEPGLAVNRARVIYNESIMWQILSWQTKEGQFLLNGVIVKDPSANPVSGFGDFPYTSELVKERHDVIKCADDKGKLVLMRTRNVGLDQNGAYITKQFPVDLGTLDKVIPGFSFAENPGSPHLSYNSSDRDAFGSTFSKGGESGAKPELPFGSTFSKGGKGGCNPCVALNDPPDYSCPFKLDIMGVKPGVSGVWARLWSIQ
jgi:hypothetical protein